MGLLLMVEIRVCFIAEFCQFTSVSFDLNLWFTMGDMAWIITSSAFVWLMIPGVGFFYSGLTGQKSALSLILLSFISVSVASFQVHPFLIALNTVVSMRIFPRLLQVWRQIYRKLCQHRLQRC